MSTVKPTSKVYTGSYNTKWAALETAKFKAQYLKEVYEPYGDLVNLSNILQFAGRTMNVPNAEIKHFERYAPQAVITTLGAITTGSAGADISFQIATSDYDANDNPPLRLYDSIEIPHDYMPSGVYEPRLYRISAITGSDDDLTFTAQPFNKAGTYSTASQISTEVPTGTNLRIAHTSFGAGTGQPTPKTDNYATRSHVATILADSLEIEGGQMAQAFEEAILVDMKRGGKGLLLSPVLELGRKLDKQIESYIISGERNDNTGMVMTSQAGSYSTPVKSGFGFMRWADILAQKAYRTSGLSASDLRYRKLLLQSQGVATKHVTVFCGPEYLADFEDAGLEYTQQFSSSDLLDSAKNLGVEFRGILKDGILYTPVQLDAFADPTSFGINVGDSYSYSWPYVGLYVPDVKNEVKMNNKKLSLSNIMIGYVSNNGEDRTRMIGYEAGMNGVDWMPNGNMVSHEYDKIEIHMKTELMCIVVNANQWILDRKA